MVLNHGSYNHVCAMVNESWFIYNHGLFTMVQTSLYHYHVSRTLVGVIMEHPSTSVHGLILLVMMVCSKEGTLTQLL